jgi:nitrate/nitrite transporter NarK
MNRIYDWFGGRKMFTFFLLLIINSFLAVMGKFKPGFGEFCIYLYAVVVLGNVGSKFGKKIDN